MIFKGRYGDLFLLEKKRYSYPMEILHWSIDPKLERETIDNYRTDYALKLENKDALTMIRELTFDGSAPKITIQDIEDLFDFIENNFLRGKFNGVGLEVGAGPLTFSSVLAKRPNVRKVYGVEICRPVIENLAPKVSNYILPNSVNKVVGVVGSFDQVELPDESVDFVFDFLSLHHSNDLGITLKECRRVLKRGGFILCLDKARPDKYSQKDLNELMDTEYDENYKKQFGLPLEPKLTRRMNGEREYRLKDWAKYLKDSGFKSVEYYLLDKVSGLGLSYQAKKAISLLPVFLQKLVNNFLPKPRYNHRFIHEDKNRIYSKLLNPFRKEISLIIAYK